MKFEYKAKTLNGEIKSGTIEAGSDSEAVELLSQQGYYVISLSGTGEGASEGLSFDFFRRRIKLSDLVLFTTQLADLLASGVPLLKGLEILARQFKDKKLGEIINSIGADVKGGSSFYNAVNKYKEAFPPILASLIATGEASGNLDQTLREAGSLFQREEELKTKLKTASIYPLMIILMGVITVFVLLSFVIPKISQVFTDLGGVLPLPTRILLSISDIFYRFWPFIIVAVGLIFYLFKKIRDDPAKRVYLDKIYLKIPILKNIMKDSETLHFSRTLGILLTSGVPILQALENTETVLTLADYKNFIRDVRGLVKDGGSLSSALKKKEIFSPLVQDIISIGEEGGKLDEALVNIANIHEKKLDYTLKVATQLIEPILILVVGFVIGMIVIGMLLPLFKLNLLIK